MGGDGNGYFNSKTGGVLKGLGVATSTIATLAAGEEGVQVFHTRLATVGGAYNELNHPFDCGKYGMLVHNGGWFDYDCFDESFAAMSDTATAAALVKKHGPGVLMSDALSHSGVWVLIPREGDGYPTVFHNGQHGFCVLKLGKAATGSSSREGWMAASETPKRGMRSVTYLRQGDVKAILPDGSLVDAVLDPVEPEPDRAPYWVRKYKHSSYTAPGRPGTRKNDDSYGWEDYAEYSDYNTAGKITYGKHGKWVPCTVCGTYELVDFKAKTSDWSCAECDEWYAKLDGSIDHHIESEKNGKESKEQQTAPQTTDTSPNLPALRDKGVELGVEDLFPRLDADGRNT